MQTRSKADLDAQKLVTEYYIRLDAGRSDILDIFTEDAQFYFPKFGISVGKASFGDLIAGLLTTLETISHDIPNLDFIIEGNKVSVEGTTKGRLLDGTEWVGGKTSGGRFASVFEIKNGLLSAMRIYLDPDYAGADTARFLWTENANRRW